MRGATGHGPVNLSPGAARRILLLLTATRWFPVGLVVAAITLLPLERGLSIAETMTLASVTGLVVFALELPTGGIADALGRRPVLIVAAAVQVVAAGLFVVASSFWMFAVASAAMGVFRALDSGPLEAWFVDAVHARRPGADVDRTLAHQGTVLGVSMALGALVSGGLVWWHPLRAWSALTLPFAVYTALAIVHLIMVGVLLKEARAETGEPAPSRVRAAVDSARAAPSVVAEGVQLARTNRVLRGLLLVEALWSVAMVVMESFQPIRLAELVGSEEQAGVLMGPVASAGWAVFAGGSALGALAARRWGVARAAVVTRIMHGLAAVWMGLAAGPAALVAAYLVTYGLHGTGGPLVRTLLHRESSARTRATVLSMASMTGFAAFAVASPVLGWTAEVLSTAVAMVVGGAVSVLGAWFLRAAVRSERDRLAAGMRTTRI
ncbi:MFS transporter [Georgenia alba]|uniref:MFS transporter n=1 Tax=Georgenia alba TaxID=2233858 RepID=A0ABW2QB12_9MICO